jgi:hypothetical protein
MLSLPRPAALALVLATATLLAACGKGDGTSSTTGAAPASTSAAARPTAAPTATAAPAAPTTAAPAKGGVCAFTGAWTGTYPPGPYPFSGTPFEFNFNADGTGVTKSQRADQEFAWKQEAGAFSIHGVKVERGGRFSCSKDETGKYTPTFTPDCGTVTFKLVQDGCKGRSKTMDGASMKRK